MPLYESIFFRKRGRCQILIFPFSHTLLVIVSCPPFVFGEAQFLSQFNFWPGVAYVDYKMRSPTLYFLLIFKLEQNFIGMWLWRSLHFLQLKAGASKDHIDRLINLQPFTVMVQCHSLISKRSFFNILIFNRGGRIDEAMGPSPTTLWLVDYILPHYFWERVKWSALPLFYILYHHYCNREFDVRF